MSISWRMISWRMSVACVACSASVVGGVASSIGATALRYAWKRRLYEVRVEEMEPIARRSSRRAGARKTKTWKRNVMRIDLRRASTSEQVAKMKVNNAHHHDGNRSSGAQRRRYNRTQSSENDRGASSGH